MLSNSVLLVEELEALHVPGDVAGVGHDLQLRHRGDEALLLLLEVPGVGEGQSRLRLPEHLEGELRRRLALRVEMPGRGSICWARAAPPSKSRSPATAKAAAVAGADWMISRLVGILFFPSDGCWHFLCKPLFSRVPMSLAGHGETNSPRAHHVGSTFNNGRPAASRRTAG